MLRQVNRVTSAIFGIEQRQGIENKSVTFLYSSVVSLEILPLLPAIAKALESREKSKIILMAKTVADRQKLEDQKKTLPIELRDKVEIIWEQESRDIGYELKTDRKIYIKAEEDPDIRGVEIKSITQAVLNQLKGIIGNKQQFKELEDAITRLIQA